MSAVLFEGGTFRPIFSCGVMDALLENHVMFPYCIGVSAGSADAASYISKQPKRNLNILLKYRNDKRYLSRRNFLKERSVFGIQFAFQEIPNRLDPFDMETFCNYKGKFVSVTTNAKTGKPTYFTNKDLDTEFKVMMATCALPVFFPAIEINGEKYYDGGLSNPIPIDKVWADGNEKCLIVLTRPKGYIKKPGKYDKMAARILHRKYPAIAERIMHRYEKYNKSVEICEKLERDGKAIILRPKKSMNSFEKDTNVLRSFYKQGYRMAMERMDEIKKMFPDSCES